MRKRKEKMRGNPPEEIDETLNIARENHSKSNLIKFRYLNFESRVSGKKFSGSSMIISILKLMMTVILTTAWNRSAGAGVSFFTWTKERTSTKWPSLRESW